jgi:hypothetical protein
MAAGIFDRVRAFGFLVGKPILTVGQRWLRKRRIVRREWFGALGEYPNRPKA